MSDKNLWDLRCRLVDSLTWTVGDRVTITAKGNPMSSAFREGRSGVIRKVEFGAECSSGVLLFVRFDDKPRGRLGQYDASWFVPAPERES